MFSIAAQTTDPTTVKIYTCTSGEGTVVGQSLFGPSPFNPSAGAGIIKYTLSNDAETKIYLFDISGNLAKILCCWRRRGKGRRLTLIGKRKFIVLK